MSMNVSIIVPVYNGEKYISKCLDSILAQTYKMYELILVDDGSQDGSAKLCDEYARCDHRIKTIHQENKGQNAARLAGLCASSCEYVLFIDDDDWIDDDYVEKMVIASEKWRFDVVTSGLIIDTEDGECESVIYDGVTSGDYKESNIKKSVLRNFFCDQMTNKQGITHSLSNKLIKKSYVMSALNQIDKRITLCEDGAVLFNVLSEIKTLRVTNYSGYHYVQHSTSTIHSYKIENLWRLKLLKEFYESVFLQKELEDIELYNSMYEFIKLNANKITYHELGLKLESKLIVPSELPGKCENVIVYGAGKKGHEFVDELKRNSRFKMKAWVDQNYESLRTVNEKIISPQEIFGIEFDYIFIAIENRYVAKTVENNLVDMGVPSRKIWIVQVKG